MGLTSLWLMAFSSTKEKGWCVKHYLPSPNPTQNNLPAGLNGASLGRNQFQVRELRGGYPTWLPTVHSQATSEIANLCATFSLYPPGVYWNCLPNKQMHYRPTLAWFWEISSWHSDSYSAKHEHIFSKVFMSMWGRLSKTYYFCFTGKVIDLRNRIPIMSTSSN